MDFGKMSRRDEEPPEGFDEADEFAAQMAALKSMAQEQGMIAPQAAQEATQQAPQASGMPTPKAKPKHAPRGLVEAATGDGHKRAALWSKTLTADFLADLKTLFETPDYDEEGKAHPCPAVSIVRDGLDRLCAYRVDFPDGFRIEDEGHTVRALALDTLAAVDDSVFAARLFDYLDAFDVWSRWTTANAEGVGDAQGRGLWVLAAYREAFHRSRPLLPSFTVGHAVSQMKPAWWLQAMQDMKDEADARADTLPGQELLGKIRWMRDCMDRNDPAKRPHVSPSAIREGWKLKKRTAEEVAKALGRAA